MAAKALLALALLVTLGAAEAAWLQTGYDAGRTGATPDAGPATDDVALHVRLPGVRGFAAEPLVADGHVLVLLNEPRTDQDFQGIVRVALATAAVERWVPLDALPLAMFGDAAHLYVLDVEGLLALDRATGAQAWRWPLPFEPAAPPVCPNPVTTGDAVFLWCSLPQAGSANGGTSDSVIVALDAASGAVRWTWRVDAEDQVAPGTGALPPLCAGPPFEGCLAAIPLNPPAVAGLAAGNGLVFLSVREAASTAGTSRLTLWALDAASGEVRWSTTGSEGAVESGGSLRPNASAPVLRPTPSLPAVTPTLLVAKLGDLVAINPLQGNVLWREVIGLEDFDPGENFGTGLVATEDAIFAASKQTLYRFDPAGRSSTWRRTVDPSFGETFQGPLVLADGVVYVRANLSHAAGRSIYAFDAEDGNIRWRREFLDPAAPRSAVLQGLGEGVLAVAGRNGNLTVIGSTAASPRAAAAASSLYPAPGVPVRVDLSASVAGAQGAPSMYRADWGDGNVTDWQASPVLAHAYAAPGDVRARFQVRNDANQTASAFATFRVGATPPVPLTPLQVAFAPENQNVTFFLIGLAITGLAAAPSVARLRRRRHRLQKELAAVEQAYEHTKDRFLECEAALAERKARARGLLLDEKLDEPQFAILEKRIEELAQEVRLRTLDERLAFLPHGMVRSLQAMLADGRINAWERRTLLEALERERTLTADQRAQTKALIDTWFARDLRAGEE